MREIDVTVSERHRITPTGDHGMEVLRSGRTAFRSLNLPTIEANWLACVEWAEANPDGR